MRILAVQRPGFFNFEGGSYAKTIGLSAKNEPEIYRLVCRLVSAARSHGVSLNNKGHNRRIVSRYAHTSGAPTASSRRVAAAAPGRPWS